MIFSQHNLRIVFVRLSCWLVFIRNVTDYVREREL